MTTILHKPKPVNFEINLSTDLRISSLSIFQKIWLTFSHLFSLLLSEIFYFQPCFKFRNGLFLDRISRPTYCNGVLQAMDWKWVIAEWLQVHKYCSLTSSFCPVRYLLFIPNVWKIIGGGWIIFPVWEDKFLIMKFANKNYFVTKLKIEYGMEKVELAHSKEKA